MNTFARTALVSVAALSVLSACASSPETLRLSGSPERLAAGAPDLRGFPWVSYELSATLPDLGDSAHAYELTAPSLRSSKQRFSDLARHLGVDGEPVLDPDNDSTWTIGLDPETWAGMHMYVGDAETGWVYSSGTVSAAVGCLTVAEDLEDLTGTCAQPSAPEAPENLPTEAEAEAAMAELLRAGGEDLSEWKISAQVDEWAAWAQAVRLVGGVETASSWWVSFGENAEVTNASGIFSTPRKASSYPLVDPAEAMERLTASMYAARSADIALPVVSDPSEMPEPQVVTVTSARLGLMPAWLQDGRVMLLPAYIYSNVDGDVGTVFAIADEYLSADTSTEPEPAPEPLPDEGGETPLPELPALAGLTEAEATSTAEAAGFTVRVASRDGEQFPHTQDYRPDRVNLVVEDDVVTEVWAG